MEKGEKNGSLGKKPRTGKYKNCTVCKKEFYRKPFGVQTAKYCSYACRNEGAKKGKDRICEICRKKYYVSPGQIRWHGSSFCSRQCQSKGMGIRQRGKSKAKKAGRIWSARQADKTFSDFIRKRDGWTCRNCKKEFHEKTGQLHNSHFWSRKRWATRFDPENCIALCFYCHYWQFEKEKQGIYRDVMISWLGQEKYAELEGRSKKDMKKYDAIKNFMDWIEPHLPSLVGIKKRTAFIYNEDGQSVLDL